ASLHEVTGESVAIAFNAANLEPVARALKKKSAGLRIVIAADNDESGVGESQARAAASVAGGDVVMPEEVGKDWNDVYRERRADAVRAAFAALPKQVEQPAEPPAEHRDVQLDDFHALMPMHKYIYVPSGDLWPAESINNRLYPVPIQGEKLKPATWLD